MYKNLTITSILGGIAVILGAFGAHVLKSKLSAEALLSFETAVRYQFIHVLVLLFVNIFSGFSVKQKQILTAVFVIGIIFFSGSIYALYLINIPIKSIWFVTPLGGMILILGWILMTVYFIRKTYQQSL